MNDGPVHLCVIGNAVTPGSSSDSAPMPRGCHQSLSEQKLILVCCYCSRRGHNLWTAGPSIVHLPVEKSFICWCLELREWDRESGHMSREWCSPQACYHFVYNDLQEDCCFSQQGPMSEMCKYGVGAVFRKFEKKKEVFSPSVYRPCLGMYMMIGWPGWGFLAVIANGSAPVVGARLCFPSLLSQVVPEAITLCWCLFNRVENGGP